jgi:transposase
MSIFQACDINAEGNVIIRCQRKHRHALPFFRKQPPRLVGVKACASSHRRGGAGVRQGH